MAGKHDKTLEAIFAEPARSNIRWDAFVGLVESRGGSVRGAGGSPFIFVLNGVREVFHRPHPNTEMPRTLVRRARRFLSDAGVTP